jgi:hypothetical protein
LSVTGYGHIAPSTTTGRAVTIVYAIFGIPLFLILLADFGKVFTRGMKFLWAFVRRVYYTGSCRKVRHTGPVQVRLHKSQNFFFFFIPFDLLLDVLIMYTPPSIKRRKCCTIYIDLRHFILREVYLIIFYAQKCWRKKKCIPKKWSKALKKKSITSQVLNLSFSIYCFDFI